MAEVVDQFCCGYENHQDKSSFLFLALQGNSILLFLLTFAGLHELVPLGLSLHVTYSFIHSVEGGCRLWSLQVTWTVLPQIKLSLFSTLGKANKTEFPKPNEELSPWRFGLQSLRYFVEPFMENNFKSRIYFLFVLVKALPCLIVFSYSRKKF